MRVGARIQPRNHLLFLPTSLLRAHTSNSNPRVFSSYRQVLDVKMPFDEKQLLLDNLPYLKRTLKIDSLAVHHVTDAEAVAKAAVPVDVASAYPGAPVTAFLVQPATSS